MKIFLMVIRTELSHESEELFLYTQPPTTFSQKYVGGGLIPTAAAKPYEIHLIFKNKIYQYTQEMFYNRKVTGNHNQIIVNAFFSHLHTLAHIQILRGVGVQYI